jgi:phospholipid/cholesterol/gamma-HCH transport system substrate-binding protein
MANFSERNPVTIALAGVVVLAALFGLLFNLNQFPELTGQGVYSGEFAHAAGLRPGDPVRVAGAPVGQVQDMELAGDHVVVSFEVGSDAGRIGASTVAAIKTETLLGRKFLELTPRGSGELDPGTAIPLSRTSVPYDIPEELGNVASLGKEIDTQELAKALDAASGAFADAPPEMRQALRGLGRFAETIHSRDALLSDLLGNAENMSAILAGRNREMSRLVVDGDSLLKELHRRRGTINTMLVNVSSVADQLSGLIGDNSDRMGPLLRDLEAVLDVLRENKGNIEAALRKLGPTASSFGEAIASGPFWNIYFHNLNLVPSRLLPQGGN